MQRYTIACVGAACMLMAVLWGWSMGRGLAADAALNTARIEQLTGVKGEMNDKEGVCKVSVPRTDLAVTAAGIKLTPPMGLTSWAAFHQAGTQTMVMGDIVLGHGASAQPPPRRPMESGGLRLDRWPGSAPGRVWCGDGTQGPPLHDIPSWQEVEGVRPLSPTQTAQEAILWGDPKTGEHGVLNEWGRNVRSGWQTRASDARIVVVRGTFAVTVEGQRARELDAGGFVLIPQGVKANFGCAAMGRCTFVLYHNGSAGVQATPPPGR